MANSWIRYAGDFASYRDDIRHVCIHRSDCQSFRTMVFMNPSTLHALPNS